MDKEFVHKKYQGMTLVELLVSLLLSAMLFSMMFNAFLFIKKCVLTQQALVRLQINARTIDYLLGKALRNSGSLGCQRLRNDLLLSAETDILLSDYGLINTQGIKGVLPGDLPRTLGASKRVLQRAVTPSDILWLQSGERFIDTQRTMKQGTILIGCDCQRATFYRWQDKRSVNPPFATVNRLASTVYYVGKTKRHNAKGNLIYALYSTDFNGRTLELVEGVELLEFSYGSLKQGQLVYQRAHEVDDWYAIVSVRLKALLNSVEESDPQVQKWWSFEWPLLLR